MKRKKLLNRTLAGLLSATMAFSLAPNVGLLSVPASVRAADLSVDRSGGTAVGYLTDTMTLADGTPVYLLSLVAAKSGNNPSTYIVDVTNSGKQVGVLSNPAVNASDADGGLNEDTNLSIAIDSTNKARNLVTFSINTTTPHSADVVDFKIGDNVAFKYVVKTTATKAEKFTQTELDNLFTSTNKVGCISAAKDAENKPLYSEKVELEAGSATETDLSSIYNINSFDNLPVSAISAGKISFVALNSVKTALDANDASVAFNSSDYKKTGDYTFTKIKGTMLATGMETSVDDGVNVVIPESSAVGEIKTAIKLKRNYKLAYDTENYTSEYQASGIPVKVGVKKDLASYVTPNDEIELSEVTDSTGETPVSSGDALVDISETTKITAKSGKEGKTAYIKVSATGAATKVKGSVVLKVAICDVDKNMSVAVASTSQNKIYDKNGTVVTKVNAETSEPMVYVEAGSKVNFVVFGSLKNGVTTNSDSSGIDSTSTKGKLTVDDTYAGKIVDANGVNVEYDATNATAGKDYTAKFYLDGDEISRTEIDICIRVVGSNENYANTVYETDGFDYNTDHYEVMSTNKAATITIGVRDDAVSVEDAGEGNVVLSGGTDAQKAIKSVKGNTITIDATRLTPGNTTYVLKVKTGGAGMTTTSDSAATTNKIDIKVVAGSTIVYDAGDHGTTELKSQALTDGATSLTLAAGTGVKSDLGYRFNSWTIGGKDYAANVEINNTQGDVSAIRGSAVSGVINAIAKYDVNDYRVTFAQGAASDVTGKKLETAAIPYDDTTHTVDLSNEFARDGYGFAGWGFEQDGDVIISAKESATIKEIVDAYAEAKSDYEDATDSTTKVIPLFAIWTEKKSLANTVVTWAKDNYYYTGSEYTPENIAKELIIKESDASDANTIEATNYAITIKEGPVKNVGTYNITIKPTEGVGDELYGGQVETKLFIDPLAIADEDDFEIYGEGINGMTDGVLYIDGEVENVKTESVFYGDIDITDDVLVSDITADEDGVYSITVSALTDNVVFNDKTYMIGVPVDFTETAKIANIEDQKWTGEAIEPAVIVTNGEDTLVENVDYTVSYENNVNEGVATVNVIGVGAYIGTVKANFNIVKAEEDKPADDEKKDDEGKQSGDTVFAVTSGSYANVTASSADITFNSNEAGTYTYTIGSTESAATEMKAEANTFTVSGLDANTEYTVTITGTSASGAKSSTSVTFTTAESSGSGNGGSGGSGGGGGSSNAKTVKNADGSTTTTTTTAKGTIETTTKTNADGSKTTSKVVKNKDGSGSVTETSVSAAGTTKVVEVVTDTTGAATEVTTTVSNSKGASMKVTYAAKGTAITVSKVETTGKTAVSIPATVKVGGKTYKVTKIAASALKGNKEITKVTLGKNVKSIGKNAFNGDSKLKTIVMNKAPTTVGKNAFKGIAKKATIKIKATKKAFKSVKKLIKKSGIASTVKIKRTK